MRIEQSLVNKNNTLIQKKILLAPTIGGGTHAGQSLIRWSRMQSILPQVAIGLH
jgi:hypothetical protein